jgi:hypothetical protein
MSLCLLSTLVIDWATAFGDTKQLMLLVQLGPSDSIGNYINQWKKANRPDAGEGDRLILKLWKRCFNLFVSDGYVLLYYRRTVKY